MKRKLKFVVPIPIVLGVLFAVYTFVLAPEPAVEKQKIEGTLVPLTTGFIINLADGHYGKLSVSLLLSEAPAGSAAGSPVTLPQDSAVRAIITDELTGIGSSQLIDRRARRALLQRVLQRLKRSTDETVTQVLITDLAVQ